MRLLLTSSKVLNVARTAGDLTSSYQSTFFSSSSAGLDICRPPAVLTALLVLGEVLQNWALRAVVALAIVGKFSERIAH